MITLLPGESGITTDHDVVPAAVPLDAPSSMADCWQHIGVWGNGSCGELKTHLHCRNCPTYAAAAMRLLDARPPADYRREWTEHLSARAITATTGTPLMWSMRAWIRS